MDSVEPLLTEYREAGRTIQARIDEVSAGLPYLRGEELRRAELRIVALRDMLDNVTYGARGMMKYGKEGGP